MLKDLGVLEADAVVPQCLDNQYVSDTVFEYMLQNNLDYSDPKVSAMRDAEIQTEFIRSIVYSSQVIIQRAFLKNNDYLFKNYLPEERENLNSFARLLREEAIIPYLFTESSLGDDSDFDVRREGDRAIKALMKEVGDDVCCVRLAIEDSANKRKTDEMASRFGLGLTRLQHLIEEQRNAMAVELFNTPKKLQGEDCWKAYNEALDQLAEYAFRKAGEMRKKNQFLSRNDVYSDNFIEEGAGGEGITLGRFRKPKGKDLFILELKKLVDLIYNSNLPDFLERYTFTPMTLPSRIALQDNPNVDARHEDIEEIVANKENLNAIRRIFMSHSQKAMSLPLLKELSIADVVEVRNLPTWEQFKETQSKILKEPLHCLDLLEDFQSDFDKFQRNLSDWFNRKCEHKRTEDKYFNYVSLALSLAGKIIVAGSDFGPVQKTLAGVAMDRITKHIPKKVKGCAVKLMMNVYDKGKRKLDRERSYSMELMRNNAELTREDVINLLNSIRRKRGEDIPVGPRKQLASQGKR